MFSGRRRGQGGPKQQDDDPLRCDGQSIDRRDAPPFSRLNGQCCNGCATDKGDDETQKGKGNRGRTIGKMVRECGNIAVIFAVKVPAIRKPTAFKAPATDESNPARTRSIFDVRSSPTLMSITNPRSFCLLECHCREKGTMCTRPCLEGLSVKMEPPRRKAARRAFV